VTASALVTSLRCELVPFAEWPGGAGDLLLAIGYGVEAAPPGASETPWLAVPNRVLAPGASVERWRSSQPVRSGRHGTIAWSEDGEVLAGTARRQVGGDLAADTRAHFRDLLEAIAERGYPYLLRIWNYLPRINEGAGDDERYRLFNIGRAQAFERWLGSRESGFPSSSAVGTPGDDLRTAFLASARPPLQLENPRQTSAFRYPTEYGPQAPSFARATLASCRSGDALFLAGTASIVGHETRHRDSVTAQLEETLRNVETMIESARDMAKDRIPPLAEFGLVKVYLRHAEHLGIVRTQLARVLRPETPTLYLEADICRSDLLIEIEGLTLG